MSKIAGQYTVTYDGAFIGQVNGGVTLEYFTIKQLITGDNYGGSPQDAVYQGKECFLQLTGMEYDNTALAAAFWPYGSAFGVMGLVGRLDVASDIIEPIVLTAVTGPTARPTASPGSPISLTAARCVLAEGFPVSILFAPALREITLRFRVYPSDPAGNAPDGTETFVTQVLTTP